MKRIVPFSGYLMAAGLSLVLFSGVAHAQDARSYRNDISAYQLRVEKIKMDGDTSRYNSEMSQIASWIDEALILIGRDDAQKVKSLVLKIGVYVDFVEASMKRDVALGRAIEAESKLKALRAEYGKLEAQVQQLAAEEEVLQKKLNGGN